MLGSKRTQQGISAIGVLGAITGLAALITLVLRLGPHYIDWQTMQSVVGDLPASQVHTMSKKDIRETLQKRFRVNSLRDFEIKEIVEIEREKTETKLAIQYERRENLLANVDVVLTFSEEYRYQ